MLRVGDVVRLKTGCLGNLAGHLGVVYEEYDLGEGPGVSVIFVNGEYDGFSPRDQGAFLHQVGHDEACENYKFTNVMKLSQDFRAGVFNNHLKYVSG